MIKKQQTKKVNKISLLKILHILGIHTSIQIFSKTIFQAASRELFPSGRYELTTPWHRMDMRKKAENNISHGQSVMEQTAEGEMTGNQTGTLHRGHYMQLAQVDYSFY